MAGVMRVVELADELGLTMFEILDLCDRIGIEAVNGATELPDREAGRLRRLFGAPEPEPAPRLLPMDEDPVFPSVVDEPVAAVAETRIEATAVEQVETTEPPLVEAGADLPVPTSRLDEEPQIAEQDTDAVDRESEKERARADKRARDEEKAAEKAERRRIRDEEKARRDEAAKSLKSAETKSSTESKNAVEDDGREVEKSSAMHPALRWAVPAVAAVVVIAIGAVLFGGGGDRQAAVPDGDPVDALAVAVGTCFNAELGSTLAEVGAVDCDTPHVGEVFAVSSYPAAAGAGYPGSSDLAASGGQRCAAAFDTYVGEAGVSSSWRIAVTHPDESAWDQLDDRTLICSVVGDDGVALTGSVAAGS